MMISAQLTSEIEQQKNRHIQKAQLGKHIYRISNNEC